MRYRYTATTAKGRMESGSIEAPSAEAAADQIRASGLLIVSLRREGGGLGGLFARFEWVTPETKVAFAKHLSLMIRAGLPVDEALRALVDQAQGRFRRDLTAVHNAVESGRPLWEGFAGRPGTFSELTVAAVRAGEASGTLGENLDGLALQMTKNYELVRKIRGAMLYPIVVLTAALGVGIGLSTFVLPRIIELFKSITVQLPLMTRILLAFSNFMVTYGTQALLCALAAVAGLIVLLRSKPVRPLADAALLRFPVFGTLARNYSLAMCARTMATLLASGMPIGDALQVAADGLQNRSFRTALLRVKAGTERGMPASTLLEDEPRLFPSVASRMIAVGERTGKLEETFGYLAEFYEDEVDVMTKNLSTLLEPLLLLVIGLVVAFIAVSIISPIYNFIGNIQRL